MAKNDYNLGKLEADVTWLKEARAEDSNKLDLLIAKHNEHKGIKKVVAVALGFVGGIIGHFVSSGANN